MTPQQMMELRRQFWCLFRTSAPRHQPAGAGPGSCKHDTRRAPHMFAARADMCHTFCRLKKWSSSSIHPCSHTLQLFPTPDHEPQLTSALPCTSRKVWPIARRVTHLHSVQGIPLLLETHLTTHSGPVRVAPVRPQVAGSSGADFDGECKHYTRRGPLETLRVEGHLTWLLRRLKHARPAACQPSP